MSTAHNYEQCRSCSQYGTFARLLFCLEAPNFDTPVSGQTGTLSDDAKVSKDEKIHSTTAVVAGFEWRLLVFPKGRRSSDCDADSLGVYLQCVRPVSPAERSLSPNTRSVPDRLCLCSRMFPCRRITSKRALQLVQRMPSTTLLQHRGLCNHDEPPVSSWVPTTATEMCSEDTQGDEYGEHRLSSLFNRPDRICHDSVIGGNNHDEKFRQSHLSSTTCSCGLQLWSTNESIKENNRLEPHNPNADLPESQTMSPVPSAPSAADSRSLSPVGDESPLSYVDTQVAFQLLPVNERLAPVSKSFRHRYEHHGEDWGFCNMTGLSDCGHTRGEFVDDDGLITIAVDLTVRSVQYSILLDRLQLSFADTTNVDWQSAVSIINQCPTVADEYIKEDVCLRSPLHVAIVSGKRQYAEMMLFRGASVQNKDVYGCTPLQVAIETGDMAMSKLLVACYGANVDDPDCKDETPLFKCFQAEDRNDLHLLVKLRFLVHELHADIHKRNRMGRTILFPAVRYGSPGILVWLLTCMHVDPRVLDYRGESAAEYAFRHNMTVIAQHLIVHMDLLSR